MPTITASPNPTSPSSVVTVSGSGFVNARTRLLLDGAGSSTNIFRPRKDGTFSVGITVSSSVKTQTLVAEQLSSVWKEVARTSVVVSAPTPMPSPTGLVFGTLMTNSDRAATEYAAGLRIAGHEAFWDRIEKSDGVWDTNELGWKKAEHDRLRAAGLLLALEPGIHYPPPYVYGLSGGRYVNQFGGVGGRPNLTWSPAVRDRVTRYITKLAATLDFSTYDAIRVGAGGDVEALFPTPNADGVNSNAYWAYDTNAQAACPLPNLKPGDSSPNWAAWYGWYLDSMVSEIKWKMNLYSSLGFTGVFHICMPGSGARPSVMDNSIANRLTTYSEVMARGAAWAEVARRLAGNPRVVLYCSSAAEYAAADYTTPEDINRIVTDTTLNSWSSMRWLTFLAKKYGLGAAGENPGFGDSTNYASQDTVLCHQAKVGGWSSAFWAHDHNLFDGTSGVTLADYANAIKTA